MPDDYLHVMIWRRALGLASLELLALVILGYIGLTVYFFAKREIAVGIVCAVCTVPGLPVGILIALAFGWLRASRWQIKAFMALWTGLVALLLLNVTAGLLLPHDVEAALARSLFGPVWPGLR